MRMKFQQLNLSDISVARRFPLASGGFIAQRPLASS